MRFTMGQMIRTLILMLMFFCSVDIFNRHQICLFAMCILFIIDLKRKIYMDGSFMLLLAFSITLFIFNPTFNDSITNVIKAFNFPLCYVLGRSLFITDSQTNLRTAEKNMKTVAYIVGVGTFVHYFLNMTVNFGRSDRNGIEFWSGKQLSATGQAAYACFIVGIIAAILFSPKVGKMKKLMAIGALIVVVLYNLVLSGRTLFVLIAAIMLLAYFFKSYEKKTNIMKTLISLGLVVAILVFLYSVNIFNIKTTFENSNFYDRFYDDTYGGRYTQGLDEDTRMKHKVYFLTHLGESFFGGGHLKKTYGHDAHDLYLDTYDESGIFAALIIIVYIVSSLSRCFKCIKNKHLLLETKQLVLCIYAIVNVMFFMEPIVRGSPWLLFSYCLVDGVVAYMLKCAKDDKISQNQI